MILYADIVVCALIWSAHFGGFVVLKGAANIQFAVMPRV